MGKHVEGRRVLFRDAPVGSILVTPCGQYYRKRSKRTVEFAPGHSHYREGSTSWFYNRDYEVFIMPDAAKV